jgi:hypothetical protein
VERTLAAFAVEVGGGGRGGGEQQVGKLVDLDAELFFWPRRGQVETAQAGFDVGQRKPESGRGPGPAKRARRVALDEDQCRRAAEPMTFQRIADRVDMVERVEPARTAERQRRLSAETMVGEIESGMLTGQVKPDRDVGADQLARDRRELDGFGSGSDDETNMIRLQRSPWLRRRQCGRSGRTRQAPWWGARRAYLKLSA